MNVKKSVAGIASLAIVLMGGGTMAAHAACGEASCVSPQGSYISHFTGTGCTGTESYYLPYDNWGYACRPWDGGGECGTVHRTVTNKSYKYNGTCYNAWPSGNTLNDFVTVYRGAPPPPPTQPPVACGWASPTGGAAPLGVSLYAFCSYDPDGGSITNAYWNVWSGSTWGTFSYYTFYTPGSYPVWLTVWDDEGQSSSTFVGTIWVH